MDVVWTEFARAGLTKHVPVHTRRAAEDWINARLRTEPWLCGRPAVATETSRVGSLVAGAYIRFLFDYDDERVRVLSISKDTITLRS